MRSRNVVLFLQILLLSVICFFSGLTYWSFLVQEEVLLRIERTLKEKGNSLAMMPLQTEKKVIIPPNDASNLLTPDPFITQALQKLRAGKKPKETFRLATYGKPDNLSPFSQWADVSDWYSLCVGSLASLHVGSYTAFAPNLAEKIERKDLPEKGVVEFWVTLKAGLYWEPLEAAFFPKKLSVSDHFFNRYPVEAWDFLFYWNAIQNTQVDFPLAVSARTLMSSIRGLRVIDTKTFVVEVPTVLKEDGKHVIPSYTQVQIFSLSPLPRFVYLYRPDGTQIVSEEDVAKSSSFAQSFTSHFALNVIPSCGPWVFNGLTEQGIDFKHNSNYPDPYLANWENISVRFYTTPDAIYRDFQAGNLDLCYVPRDKIPDLKKQNNPNVKMLSYPERAYMYIGFNNTHPILSSKEVRQALDYAVDKQRIIEQVLDGLGEPSTGPFLPSSENRNSAITCRLFSPLKAKEMLAKEGWKDRGDGVLEKEIDGKKVVFSFSLVYFTNNPISKAVCELVSLQLKEIGVDARLRGVEVTELSKGIEEKSFDAYFLAWLLPVPPENMEQIWHSAQASVKGSSNTIGFVNKEVDRLIDALKLEDDPIKRLEMYHQMHAIIADESPYLFLYSDVRSLAYWNDVEMVFIPRDRQDLCPGAVDPVPHFYYSWHK